MFNNQQIMDLPKHSDISFKPLADKALLHTQLNWLAFYIPLIGVLIAVCYFNETFANNAQTYLLIGVPILVVISMLYNMLGIKLQGVAVRSHDIVFKKGIIWQQVTILPLARVQHIEIHRGPIERKLDLASLKLFSAGGVSADLQISGLTHDDCKNIRQFVQSYRQENTCPELEFADE
ncbi:PH domain-containing protein [Pseudoalteromonas sp. SWXJZ94C]|uniref:PH domain-containing protein n=1 Tax=unclassified Pseudoalteromonas TaxID=194690 RepID=UPI0003F5C9A1|nr:PH domain-containing protein [Pseudoalteromonas sp. TB64]MBH0057158.1 PH domain-containing protein [Pseudoalteromonas sp. SWXJZ94C]